MRFSLMVLIFSLSYAVLAETVKDEYTVCDFKGDVAASVYLNRNDYPLQEFLRTVKEDWKEHSKDDWHYASYVDSERIIRDAFRKSSGKYRRDCCTPEISAARGAKAISDCQWNGF